MHTTLTPAETALIRQRPDIKQRLYRDEAGRWHVVHYFERVDEGQGGYTRRAIVMWNPEALGRGFVVISPEVFFKSTEPMPVAVGEAVQEQTYVVAGTHRWQIEVHPDECGYYWASYWCQEVDGGDTYTSEPVQVVATSYIVFLNS